MSVVGPSSKARLPFSRAYEPNPPGKYADPVNAVSTSAAARLNVLCPEAYAGNEGVTNVGSWYGTHAVASIQWTPAVCVDGSLGVPPQARIAMRPTYFANAWWRCPTAEDAVVITSMRPGTRGRPSALYDGLCLSLD